MAGTSIFDELMDELEREVERITEEIEDRPGPLPEPERSEALARLPEMQSDATEAANTLAYDGPADLSNLPTDAAAAAADIDTQVAVARDETNSTEKRGGALKRIAYICKPDGLLENFIKDGPAND